jgi:hypothetical protein
MFMHAICSVALMIALGREMEVRTWRGVNGRLMEGGDERP